MLLNVAARFSHPEANREVRLGQATIAYLFQRAPRRSIGFIVRPDGLVVRAPRLAAVRDVEAALQEKSAWILRKLQEVQMRQHMQAPTPLPPISSAEKAAFRVHLVQRLNHFAPLLGVQWRSLSLGTARTRWGSARADGSIRLNVGLIRVAPALVDYVVVHELSHLREMNHSPRFWAIVASVLPNHADLRKLLKRESIT
ncbi:MAG: SprT family zinc-dependent metalloprotease [Burkholderiaceae bacterium]|nr:M48 family metallopeptidase [Rhodoferax sp.]